MFIGLDFKNNSTQKTKTKPPKKTNNNKKHQQTNKTKQSPVCLFKLCQKDINFCCIRGNANADSSAKSVLDLPRAKVGVPYNDFKHCISQYIHYTCQDDWNGAIARKPVLGDWQSSYRRRRKDEIVLSHLTHSYILKKEPSPQCEHCQCNLTVRHILVKCNHFGKERYIW